VGRSKGPGRLHQLQGIQSLSNFLHLCANAHVLFGCPQICKIYLYANEPPRVLARFNRHVSRFHELSNGWGIGDETFEYWAWLTKQFRCVLAALRHLLVAYETGSAKGIVSLPT
jgi:hypothetical protein